MDQARDNSIKAQFDLPVALAILRLYNFYPDCYKTEVVRHILGMALSVPPHEGVFFACRYLLNNTSEVEDLIALATRLDNAQFKSFWVDFAKVPDAPWKHKSLVVLIRQNIFQCIAQTYDSVQFALIPPLIGLSDDETKAYLAEVGGATIDGSIVTFDRTRYPNRPLAATCSESGPTIPPLATIKQVIGATDMA